jgi:hypothetical protein
VSRSRVEEVIETLQAVKGHDYSCAVLTAFRVMSGMAALRSDPDLRVSLHVGVDSLADEAAHLVSHAGISPADFNSLVMAWNADELQQGM